MSTILRALKKLEHDKAVRKPDTAGMDLEFLESTPPAPRRSPLKIILVMGVLAGSVGGAIYLLSGGKETKTTTLPPTPPARQAAFKPATTAMPALPVQAIRSSSAAPAPVPAPAVQAEQKTAPAIPGAQAPQAAIKSQAVPALKKPAAVKPQAPHIPKSPKFPAQAAAPLSLTVNGIALSDGEKRKAIVNGMSVSVGSMIGGVKVEEILGNRVRFSHGGETFEISVGNTGP